MEDAIKITESQVNYPPLKEGTSWHIVLKALKEYNEQLDKIHHQCFIQNSEKILLDILEILKDKDLPDYYTPDTFRKLFEYAFVFAGKLSSNSNPDAIKSMGLRGASDCCIRCFTDESWKNLLDLLRE